MPLGSLVEVWDCTAWPGLGSPAAARSFVHQTKGNFSLLAAV